jgi:hypothetical protein
MLKEEKYHSNGSTLLEDTNDRIELHPQNGNSFKIKNQTRATILLLGHKLHRKKLRNDIHKIH